MKTWWALGAAALSVVLVVFVWLPMLADTATTERLSSKEAVPGIDVPVVATAGEFPDPTRRHVVNVAADGTVTLDGTWFKTFDALSRALRQRGSRTGGRRVAGMDGQRFGGTAVLRIDRSVPWGVVEAVVVACVPWMESISFVVRDGTGSERTMTYDHVDMQSSGGMTLDVGPPGEAIVDLYPSDGDPPKDALARAFGRARPIFLRIAPDVAWLIAAQAIDLAIRSRPTLLSLPFSTSPARHSDPDFRADADRWRVTKPALAVRVHGGGSATESEPVGPSSGTGIRVFLSMSDRTEQFPFAWSR